MSEFDAMAFGVSILKSKGYDTTVNNDAADIFMLQKESWVSLYEKYRLADENFAAEVLRDFAMRPFVGGAGRVLEAFATFLSARSHKVPGPDWSETAQQAATEACGYCEGRGVISSVPVMSPRGAFDGVREYSFRCNCFASQKFASLSPAQDWMYKFAVSRNKERYERLRQWGQRNGIEIENEGDFKVSYRQWLSRQKGGVFQKVDDVLRQDRQEGGQESRGRVAKGAMVESIVATKESERGEVWTPEEESVCGKW
jgi:hypothetical protein